MSTSGLENWPWTFCVIYKYIQWLKIKKLWPNSLIQGRLDYVSRDRRPWSTYKLQKNKKWINKQNTKAGRHGHRGVEEYDRGQLRLMQHPATVDLKYDRLCVVVPLGEGCLKCRCHGNYGHSAGTHFLRTTLLDPVICPTALSTHLRRCDRSCCYFWLLLAISVVSFCCTVYFVFFFLLLPPSSALPLKL